MCDQTCIIVSAVVGGIVFVILLVLAIWCFLRIRKKRQQGGVYNPQEMENKDYKRKGNIDINSISMQVQPERLI